MALLAYWATPLQNRFSPAELLMSCRLRTTIPATKIGLKPLAPDYQVVTDNRSHDRREPSIINITEPDPSSALNRVNVSGYPTTTRKVGQVNPHSYQARTPDETELLSVLYPRDRREIHPLPQSRSWQTTNQTFCPHSSKKR